MFLSKKWMTFHLFTFYTHLFLFKISSVVAFPPCWTTQRQTTRKVHTKKKQKTARIWNWAFPCCSICQLRLQSKLHHRTWSMLTCRVFRWPLVLWGSVLWQRPTFQHLKHLSALHLCCVLWPAAVSFAHWEGHVKGWAEPTLQQSLPTMCAPSTHQNTTIRPKVIVKQPNIRINDHIQIFELKKQTFWDKWSMQKTW